MLRHGVKSALNTLGQNAIIKVSHGGHDVQEPGPDHGPAGALWTDIIIFFWISIFYWVRSGYMQ